MEVSRLWTAKATTSSTQRRLATRLGEASCSDRVSVVKATSPDTDNPGVDKASCVVRKILKSMYQRGFLWQASIQILD